MAVMELCCVAFATAAMADELPAVPSAVAAAAENVTMLNGQVNPNAQVYFYLHSASWCGPCKALMPEIVKEYKKMKKKNVEIILIGHDHTPEAAKSYLEHYEAGFPGVLFSSADAQKLPAITSPAGIPTATIVDAKGNVLYNGPGKGALEWKKYCKPAKKKK